MKLDDGVTYCDWCLEKRTPVKAKYKMLGCASLEEAPDLCEICYITNEAKEIMYAKKKSDHKKGE
jgi:hypothetical protein